MATIDLDRLAAIVERYMVDTITVRRNTGTVYNEVTMEETPQYTEIYSGIGFAVPAGDPEATIIGSVDKQRIQYEVAIPKTAAEVLPDDEVLAASMPNDVLFVRDQLPTTFETHKRIKAFKDKEAV